MSADFDAVAVLPSPTKVRRTTLDMLYASRASHLGPCLSMVEILIATFAACDLRKIRRGSSDRDRVFVSKGHSAAAVYATMFHFGLLSRDDLESYHQDGSLLSGHVSHAVPCVEHSTGALGHGLSVACGCALGLRSKGHSRARVFAILGDGEIQEGSVWEAAMFARHHRLENLLVMIDNNRISSITETAAVLDMNPLTDRFSGFGLPTIVVDGHDLAELRGAIEELSGREQTGVIVCNTVKGRGVEFAEHEPIWHYRPLSDDTYRQAVEGLRENGSQ